MDGDVLQCVVFSHLLCTKSTSRCSPLCLALYSYPELVKCKTKCVFLFLFPSPAARVHYSLSLCVPSLPSALILHHSAVSPSARRCVHTALIEKRLKIVSLNVKEKGECVYTRETNERVCRRGGCSSSRLKFLAKHLQPI